MASDTSHRLYILDTDLSHGVDSRHGRILSCRPDGSDLKTVVDNLETMPDGIAIDHTARLMYWTNMGTSLSEPGGSVECARLDGTQRQTIMAPGGGPGLFTPKQITLEPQSGKLYWCDREGMKVMRADADPSKGSSPEVLVSTGDAARADDRSDPRRWCVGVAVDPERGYVYWTQKGPSKGGRGRILRAALDRATPPRPEVVLDNLPEPIDLELDQARGLLYWTDRGDPPAGNSLNRLDLAAACAVPAPRDRVEVLATRLHEAIGLALDADAGVCYVTDLAGGVYAVDVETREKKVIFAELGDVTGIALA